MRLKIIFILSLYFLAANHSFADTVFLKSGKQVTGEIRDKTEDYVKIDFKGVLLTFFKEEIDRIEVSDSAEMPVEIQTELGAWPQVQEQEATIKPLSQNSVSEKNSDFHGEKVLFLLEQEKYEEAKKVINEWERLYPEDILLVPTKKLAMDLEMETDSQKQEKLLEEYTLEILQITTNVLDNMMGDLQAMNEGMQQLKDLNDKLEAMSNPLVEAAGKGNIAEIKKLLNDGADINMKDGFGMTALSVAIVEQKTEAVAYLLEQKADPNQRGALGMTDLMIAAAKGYTEVVKLLIKAGADTSMVDNDGETALMIAAKKGHKDIVEILEQAQIQQPEQGNMP